MPPKEQKDWELEIEELQKLVSLLPASVRSAVEEHSEMTQLLEVREPVYKLATMGLHGDWSRVTMMLVGVAI
jgi:hypothetical protein